MQSLQLWRTVLTVVTANVIFSSIWILFSDRLVLELYRQGALSTTQAQTVKGPILMTMSAAMIFAVIDVADAQSKKRIYYDAMQVDEVYDYLGENAGALFDPDVVKDFIANDLLRSRILRHEA